MKQKTLAQHLKERSKEICALNKCTDEQHNCEAYAYVRWDMQLLDICISDYFQGCSKPHAAIPLPWKGSLRALRQEVMDQCYDQIESEGEQAAKSGQELIDCPYPAHTEAQRIWSNAWRTYKNIK